MKFLKKEFNHYLTTERAIKKEEKARKERIKLGKTNPKDKKDTIELIRDFANH